MVKVIVQDLLFDGLRTLGYAITSLDEAVPELEPYLPRNDLLGIHLLLRFEEGPPALVHGAELSDCQLLKNNAPVSCTVLLSQSDVSGFQILKLQHTNPRQPRTL